MRILIVEDARPIREGLGKILTKISQYYEVVGMASDGVEGLRMIEELSPDLVIMDIQMPDMDGLTMLANARKKSISCRFIVLTAYSDFNYAKKAIELGVDNYLLKPIKIHELKRALRQVEESIAKVLNPANIYTRNYVFLSAMNGSLVIDEAMTSVIEKQYGIKPDEPIGLFVIWLGDCYQVCRPAAAVLLEGLGGSGSMFESYLIDIEEKQTFISFLYFAADRREGALNYKMKSFAEVEVYLCQTILPMLSVNLGHKAVYGWGVSAGLEQIKEQQKQITADLEWNLIYEEPRLITHNLIDGIATVPVKLPPDLEQKTRYAVAHKNQRELQQCFQTFLAMCRNGTHSPREIKDACIRYCFTVMNAAREYGIPVAELSVQDLSHDISHIISWKSLTGLLDHFREQILSGTISEEGEDSSTSDLVQKAQALIQEHYSQGITLEEISRRLYVTEEYLSTQIKKETGQTFTEIMRLCRISKIKKLLLESDLKLNQIAVMTGYSDPKYMSRVFREEVGMSPAKYRKM